MCDIAICRFSGKQHEVESENEQTLNTDVELPITNGTPEVCQFCMNDIKSCDLCRKFPGLRYPGLSYFAKIHMPENIYR